ncbi:extracellular solute-binding protein [Saxibacter everestensis]|uniref:Extracellular solute-binding protein n=1 Tax=Saxibacter everestensis TaxID=2909229 RepID=A0ABY8QXA7_9MICO|nr:extracellular solute-binding protein [Brevibacteriaceae bacterium ZFBP1038]
MTNLEPASGTRRSFLRASGLGIGALAASPLLAACNNQNQTTAMPRYTGGDPWRRFEGTTINFISENTAPTAAIAANLKPFTELTGVNVQIVNLELTALVQRVALDMASGHAQYQVIYADPYQVLAPYSAGLADLSEFVGADGYPELGHGGLKDFIPTQLNAAGKFVDDEKVFALPYDCPTMIWQYRKDIFDTYGGRMADDLGFDITPGADRTWEEYFQMAEWINGNADEVPYGTGHQAKQHDSLMCDFSNLLWAYGGDYFENGQDVGLLGTKDPGQSLLNQPEAKEAAALYNKLVGIAHPGSRGWDWDGVANALRAEQIAMTPNWHENAAANESVLPGKVGYAPLPKGPKRNAHMYGGCGIGIADNSQGAERGAAFLFLAWATSQDTQLANLKSEAGGGTPTRSSVYELPEVRKAENRPSELPNMLTADAVNFAWQEANIGLRPKIPMWNECDTAIFTGLSQMLAGQGNPEETMDGISDHVDRIVERGWVA